MALGRVRFGPETDPPGLAANDRDLDARFDRVAQTAHAGERRAREDVQRLAAQVERLGRAFDARLQQGEASARAELQGLREEIRALEAATARRLRAVEAGRDEAAAALRQEIAQAVERLTERLEAGERATAEALSGVGRRLDRLDTEIAAADARLATRLETELRDSRVRAEALVGGVRAELFRQGAALQAQAARADRRARAAAVGVGAVLLIAAAAGALSLLAISGQLLHSRQVAAPASDSVVRLRLPLRPTLPAEIPALPPPAASPVDRPPPVAGRPPPPAAAPARPGQGIDDLAVLARGAAAGDKAALARIQGLAERGAPTAQLLLAKLYEGGEGGLPQDLALARQWTRRAAERGERAAMHNFAVYLANGEGGPQDAAAAARWFGKAAAAGVVDAQFNLGLLYENGRGVERNLLEAYRWFSIAADAGDGVARGRAVALEARLSPRERAIAAKGVAAFAPGRAAEPPTPSVPLIAAAGTVAETQRLLARSGYYVGRTDGVDSPAYRQALSQYLQEHPSAAGPTLSAR